MFCGMAWWLVTNVIGPCKTIAPFIQRDHIIISGFRICKEHIPLLPFSAREVVTNDLNTVTLMPPRRFRLKVLNLCLGYDSLPFTIEN